MRALGLCYRTFVVVLACGSRSCASCYKIQGIMTSRPGPWVALVMLNRPKTLSVLRVVLALSHTFSCFDFSSRGIMLKPDAQPEMDLIGLSENKYNRVI